jgi:hypothetical protein
MFSQGLGSKSVFDAISVGGTYTLTALSRQYPYFNERLGIGTTTPNAILNVSATAGANIPALGAASSHLAVGNAVNYGTMIGTLSSGVGYIQQQRFDGIATAYNLLLQPNGGNVGIGTTSPAVKLHLLASSENEIRVQESTNNAFISLYQQATTSYLIAGRTGATPTQVLAIYTGGGEKMRIDASGNVGIGTTSPGSPLDVQCNSSALGVNIRQRSGDDFSNLVFSNSTNTALGAVGYVGTSRLRFTTNGLGDANEKLSILANGNVGIGTTSPSAKLAIESTTSDALRIGQTGNTTGNKYVSIGMDVTNQYARIEATRYGEVYLPIALNPSGGNVGIGTTSPSQKLSVSGNVSISNNNSLLLLDTAGNTGFQIRNTSSNIALIHQANNGSLRYRAGFSSNSGNAHIFAVGADTEIVRFTNDGKVGIGTTSPIGKLDVVGTAAGGTLIGGVFSNITANAAGVKTRIELPVFNGTSGGVIEEIGNSIDGYRLNIYQSQAAGVLTFGTAGDNERMRITSGGDVGIGTTTINVGGWSKAVTLRGSSNAAYEVTDGTVRLATFVAAASIGGISVETNHPLGLYTNSTERMRITSDGNVGIGTTSIASRLSVAGSTTGDVMFLKSNKPGIGSFILGCLDSDNNSLLDVYGNVLSSNYSVRLGDANDNGFPLFSISSASASFLYTNVGIGTDSPNAILDVAGDALINRVTVGQGPVVGEQNTALGQNALSSMVGGKSNIAVGFNSNSDNDVTGLTTIGVDLNTDTNLDPLGQNCLAISQFNANAYSDQVPHIYVPSSTGVGPSSIEDIITFDVNHYVGAFIEYVITTADGGEFAAGTVTVAWKDSGSGNLKDTRDVIWTSYMDDFDFLLSGTTVQLRNDSAQSARIRITVRAMIRT